MVFYLASLNFGPDDYFRLLVKKSKTIAIEKTLADHGPRSSRLREPPINDHNPIRFLPIGEMYGPQLRDMAKVERSIRVHTDDRILNLILFSEKTLFRVIFSCLKARKSRVGGIHLEQGLSEPKRAIDDEENNGELAVCVTT